MLNTLVCKSNALVAKSIGFSDGKYPTTYFAAQADSFLCINLSDNKNLLAAVQCTTKITSGTDSLYNYDEMQQVNPFEFDD